MSFSVFIFKSIGRVTPRSAAVLTPQRLKSLHMKQSPSKRTKISSVLIAHERLRSPHGD
ncbi:MAG: hypothetical protein LH613_07835 [Chamaesiphon sp.]|nr:hypothetical protein [Chamaesiphon sp.]